MKGSASNCGPAPRVDPLAGDREGWRPWNRDRHPDRPTEQAPDLPPDRHRARAAREGPCAGSPRQSPRQAEGSHRGRRRRKRPDVLESEVTGELVNPQGRDVWAPLGSFIVISIRYRMFVRMAKTRTPQIVGSIQGLKPSLVAAPNRADRAIGAGARCEQGRLLLALQGSARLLEEMLDRWEQQSIEEVSEEIERRGGDARAKLRRLFSLAADRRDLLLIDLAVRDWARHEQWVADRLRKVDNRRMDYMRTLFGDFCPTKRRSRLAAYSSSRCGSAATSWPRTTANTVAKTFSRSP